MTRMALSLVSVGVIAGSPLQGLDVAAQIPGLASQTRQKSAEPGNPKEAVQRVIEAKDRKISRFFGLGKSLLTLGLPAVDEFTAALDTAAPTDVGYLALALGVFGLEAKTAVPKLIASFPIDPTVETGIRLQAAPTGDLELASLTMKLGKGKVVSQAVASNVPLKPDGRPDLAAANLTVTYFYVIEAPAAVAALYQITGACPGVTQQAWKMWLATNSAEAR